MEAKIIDGIKVAGLIKSRIKDEIKNFDKKPGIAIILAGNNSASKIYIEMKDKACKEVGINTKNYFLDEFIKEGEIIKLIKNLNEDDNIHGIIVQMPLPEKINTKNIVNYIKPEKDIDGLNQKTIGNLMFNNEILAPCTPKGILELLDYYKIDVKGKDCTIINHSNVIGKPLAVMLLNRNATVSICHIHTKNLHEYTKKADILISAAGKPGLIKKEMIKEGAVIIDAGINKIEGKISGDVDFENVKKIAGYISPVPGGVGPMTIAMLLQNTLNAFKNSNMN